MKRLTVIVHFLTVFGLCGSLKSQTVECSPTPAPKGFESRIYFADMEVIETVSRRKLTASEVMGLLDKLPNVKTVTLWLDPPRPFSLETLAYPQYASRYTLTQAEWRELQAFCCVQLRDHSAIQEVIDHWKSIVAGTPPFGLHVQDK